MRNYLFFSTEFDFNHPMYARDSLLTKVIKLLKKTHKK